MKQMKMFSSNASLDQMNQIQPIRSAEDTLCMIWQLDNFQSSFPNNNAPQTEAYWNSQMGQKHSHKASVNLEKMFKEIVAGLRIQAYLE